MPTLPLRIVKLVPPAPVGTPPPSSPPLTPVASGRIKRKTSYDFLYKSDSEDDDLEPWDDDLDLDFDDYDYPPPPSAAATPATASTAPSSASTPIPTTPSPSYYSGPYSGPEYLRRSLEWFEDELEPWPTLDDDEDGDVPAPPGLKTKTDGNGTTIQPPIQPPVFYAIYPDVATERVNPNPLETSFAVPVRPADPTSHALATAFIPSPWAPLRVRSSVTVVSTTTPDLSAAPATPVSTAGPDETVTLSAAGIATVAVTAAAQVTQTRLPPVRPPRPSDEVSASTTAFIAELELDRHNTPHPEDITEILEDLAACFIRQADHALYLKSGRMWIEAQLARRQTWEAIQPQLIPKTKELAQIFHTRRMGAAVKEQEASRARQEAEENSAATAAILAEAGECTEDWSEESSQDWSWNGEEEGEEEGSEEGEGEDEEALGFQSFKPRLSTIVEEEEAEDPLPKVETPDAPKLVMLEEIDSDTTSTPEIEEMAASLCLPLVPPSESYNADAAEQTESATIAVPPSADESETPEEIKNEIKKNQDELKEEPMPVMAVLASAAPCRPFSPTHTPWPASAAALVTTIESPQARPDHITLPINKALPDLGSGKGRFTKLFTKLVTKIKQMLGIKNIRASAGTSTKGASEPNVTNGSTSHPANPTWLSRACAWVGRRVLARC